MEKKVSRVAVHTESGFAMPIMIYKTKENTLKDTLDHTIVFLDKVAFWSAIEDDIAEADKLIEELKEWVK